MLEKPLNDHRIGASGSLMDEDKRVLLEVKSAAEESGWELYGRIADTATQDEIVV